MTIRRLAVLALLTVACSSADPPSPTDGAVEASTDVAGDTTADGSSDAAADVSDASADTTEVGPTQDAAADVQDAGADAALDTPSDAPRDVVSDAPADVPVDRAVDAAADAAPDASADAPADRPADAVSDAGVTDAADAASDAPCINGTTRCDGELVELCRGGVWTPSMCDTSMTVPGTRIACFSNACMWCQRDATRPTICSADPLLCTTSADCVALGLGVCNAGRCARRVFTECLADADCESVWGRGTAMSRCMNNGIGRACGSFELPGCTSDVECAAGMRCRAAHCTSLP